MSLVFKLQPHPCFHFSFWSSVILFFVSESSLFNPLTSLCWELGSVGSWSNSLEPCHPCLMALRWQQLPRQKNLCTYMPASGLSFLAGPSDACKRPMLLGRSFCWIDWHQLNAATPHTSGTAFALRMALHLSEITVLCEKKTAHSGKTALVIEKLFFLIKQ